MNKAILVGRLTKDPEIRVTQQQKSAGRFSVACNRGREAVDFIDCVAFDRKAELLEKYFHKGDRIGVVGSIKTGSYTDKEGRKVRTTEVYVDEIEFLQDKPKQQSLDEYGIPVNADDEDLPF